MLNFQALILRKREHNQIEECNRWNNMRLYRMECRGLPLSRGRPDLRCRSYLFRQDIRPHNKDRLTTQLSKE